MFLSTMISTGFETFLLAWASVSQLLRSVAQKKSSAAVHSLPEDNPGRQAESRALPSRKGKKRGLQARLRKGATRGSPRKASQRSRLARSRHYEALSKDPPRGPGDGGCAS
ncbi:UNVERIFIED_CONTAM: hypothetical protein K2H54_062037 [Gekko kuhli]